MADHLMVLNVMLGKIAVNLKVYGPVEDLIQQTLSLFQVSAHHWSSTSQHCNTPTLPCMPVLRSLTILGFVSIFLHTPSIISNSGLSREG